MNYSRRPIHLGCRTQCHHRLGVFWPPSSHRHNHAWWKNMSTSPLFSLPPIDYEDEEHVIFTERQTFWGIAAHMATAIVLLVTPARTSRERSNKIWQHMLITYTADHIVWIRNHGFFLESICFNFDCAARMAGRTWTCHRRKITIIISQPSRWLQEKRKDIRRIS
jgi:hypothetical protein